LEIDDSKFVGSSRLGITETAAVGGNIDTHTYGFIGQGLAIFAFDGSLVVDHVWSLCIEFHARKCQNKKQGK
jgi:hypothetical protein